MFVDNFIRTREKKLRTNDVYHKQQEHLATATDFYR